MDWKFAVGTLFAVLSGMFALMNRHPRVYKAISPLLTDIIGVVGMLVTGLYTGVMLASDLFRSAVAKQSPDMPAATVESLVATAATVQGWLGWSMVLLGALLAGHLVFGILALLAVNEEDKKAKG